MSSSLRNYYGFKYLPLLLGLMFLFVSSLGLLNPDSINYTVNGVPEQMDFWEALIFLLIGVLLILVYLYFKDSHVYIVAMNNQSIRLQQGSRELEISWLEVESVALLRATFPPLYKLRIREHDDYYLFNSGGSGFNIAGFTTDLSDMGDLISRKKRELGI